VRLHVSPRPLPWVVLEDGTYLTPSDGGVHRLPFPKSTTCVGSTGDWIALDSIDKVAQTHTYALHNHFSGATVPLPELDAVIGKVPEDFKVRKVLMRSTTDDLIAVTGNIWRYPLILCRPGKGAWAARPLTMPYFLIIDVAFVGDKLYAISKAEDLFAINLGEDDDGRPIVTSAKRIIGHAPGHEDDVFNEGVWMGFTDMDASSNEDTEEELEEETSNEVNNYVVVGQDDADDDAEDDAEDDADDELVGDNGHNNNDAEPYVFSDEYTLSACDEGVAEGYNTINTSRHLVESRGKLLMVKRVREIPPFIGTTDRSRKVEVFEADMKAGTWVPANCGLGSGQAIFVSNRFSSIVSARGEVEEDIMYFPDTDDVFNMRSRTIRPVKPIDRLSDNWRAWVFPPNVVV
jgi:hypothetical protein